MRLRQQAAGQQRAAAGRMQYGVQQIQWSSGAVGIAGWPDLDTQPIRTRTTIANMGIGATIVVEINTVMLIIVIIPYHVVTNIIISIII